MKMLTMFRMSLAVMLLHAGFESKVAAQPYVGPGSTIEGDYLRGLGIAGWGLGLYNVNTAQAESINVDTTIRWNVYLAEVAKQQTREYVALKLADATKRKEFYKQERERILNNPEAPDVLNGNALNRVLEELLNSNLDDSTLGTSRYKVALPVDVIRHIPFKHGETGEQFSMERLLLRGKWDWTVALQDPQFDLVKKRYAEALDKALEQAIDGTMHLAVIDALEAKADDLLHRLDEVFPPADEIRYIDAKRRLDELKHNVQLLKRTPIERAISEIDQYAGTNVNDLRLFMMSHKLRFAAAKSPEERRRSLELYAALREQLDRLKSPDGAPIR